MERSEYQFLESQENKHWWFVGRRIILNKMLKKLVGQKSANENDEKLQILEIGCGTGGNLEMLSKYGDVHAIEMDENAYNIAKGKNLASDIKMGYLPDNTGLEENQFDLIVMFDVLEHIDEDIESLKSLNKFLKTEGNIFITVPAFKFLWSKHDEIAHHKRRYIKKELIDSLKQAGFEVKYISYFNFWLFPLAAIVRTIYKSFSGSKNINEDGNTPGQKKPIGFINKTLTLIFASEKYFIGKISFPFGLSLMATANKR